MEILNRDARYNYFILEELEAGIALVGTEIKSIKKGSANLKDSFIIIKNNEAFMINSYVALYSYGNQFNHDERRTRKLLLHKKEIKKLSLRVKTEGLTLVPLKIYFKNGKAKVLIGVCKGKKNYDKRNAMKEKEIKLNIKKDLKDSLR